MGEVRELFDMNALAPTPEDAAAYLEKLAARVRSGEIPLTRACLCVQANGTGGVEIHPFGAPMNWMELVGLLEMSKLKAAL